MVTLFTGGDPKYLTPNALNIKLIIEREKIMAFRIRGLMALKRWNNNPTEEKPVVQEWFLDWFFEELLDKGRNEKAIEAREVMIEFTVICEKLTKEQAIERVDTNFDYYSDRAITRWRPEWLALKKQIRENNGEVFCSHWPAITGG